ncbi:MAG: hypothetical protein FRX49_07315 [Trebouxia sp. A1-2]|nr:MAG: hypothetical protein FRX49_07315 [Trebouxia sp. A1-2]
MHPTAHTYPTWGPPHLIFYRPVGPGNLQPGLTRGRGRADGAVQGLQEVASQGSGLQDSYEGVFRGRALQQDALLLACQIARVDALPQNLSPVDEDAQLYGSVGCPSSLQPGSI